MQLQKLVPATCLALLILSPIAQARFEAKQLGNDKYMANNKDGCVVVFDRHGDRLSETSKCSSRDLRDAEEAVGDLRNNRSDSRDYDDRDHHSGSSRHSGSTYYEIHGVSDNKLRIWDDPSKHSEVVAGGVHNGEKVRGLGNCERHHGEEWCEVEYRGDRGWVMQKFLRETSGGSSSHSSSHSSSGSHSRGERFADLEGERASSAERGLEDRGFRNVDGFKSGMTAYTIWYNRKTDQCLQMAVADGRADSIVDIQRHDKCD